MARVVVVHGINNTYASRPQMADRWIPALRGGLDNAVLEGLIAPVEVAASDVECVFYGDLFRPAGRRLSGDVPPLTADDVEDGPELDLLLAWWAAAAEADPAVPSPGGRTLGPKASARAAVLALAGSRFLARVSERLLIFWLKQVTAYFTDPAIRAGVQDRFAAAISADTRVVVAHSLGSVVAYEALCAHPEWPVTDLVTLGSPLGVPHLVLHRLVPPVGTWPGVARWVNVTDSGDFVALRPTLRDVYGDRVVDVAISNGMSAHEVERYLSAAPTGAAVAAGLLNGQR
ncbi:hypothetical protein HDA40_007342 [Hamadaea flava]|uniref:Alpha/beta hydrolase n=1 Tax=Hamadaea flava TaxID=1742688 RepID=A0ABV8LXF0_9ACTN|nr:hypothetical protein [Hamadaea flava]MCP2328835.1 hypothetical protein [Hamadaea flava]